MRLLSFVAALFAAIPAFAQAPAAKSPTDIVPSNAFGFVSVRVSDFKKVESLKPILEAIAQLEKSDFSLEKILGVPLDDLDRVTMFWPSVPTEGDTLAPYIVLNTREPFNEVKVLKSMKAMPVHEAMRRARQFPGGRGFDGSAFSPPRPPAYGTKGVYYPRTSATTFLPRATGTVRSTTPKSGPPIPPPPPPPPKLRLDSAQVGDPEPKRGAPGRGEPAGEEPGDGPDLFFRDHSPYSAIYLLDNQTILLMPMGFRDRPALLNFLGQLLRRKTDGPMAEALAEAGKHTIVAAARIQPIHDLMMQEGDFPRELVPYRSLLKTQTAMVTVDLAAKTSVAAKLTFADAAQAKRAEPVLKTLIQNGVEELAELRKDKSKGAEWDAVAHPLLDLLTSSLEKAEIQADGRFVKARMEMDIGPAVTKAIAALPALVEAASARMKTSNNLKMIGLAIHNHNDAFDYIPGNIVGPDGKVLMSWRVAILPFIEQDNMYRQLDLTKAWDDPRNAKILEKMPEVFRVYGRDAEKGKTFLQMPTSPQAPAGGSPILVPGRKVRIHEIADGTSNTIMVVEAADAVDWAKPDDVLFDPAKTPKVGGQGRKLFHALLGDGSVRTFNLDKLTDKDLKAFITINGGEVTNWRD